MHYTNFWQMIYCAIIVMLCYTLQNAGKSITFNIYNASGISFLYSMQFAINYFVSPFVLLFIDAIINRLKINVILYLGSFNAFAFLLGAFVVSSCQDHDLFFCNTPTITAAIGLETLFGGIAGCLFFVGYPIYINSISNQYNKTLYFGIGYSIYSISGFAGNTIGYFTSSKLEPFKYYGILLSCLAFTQLFLLFVVDHRKIQQQEVKSFKQIFKQQYNQLKSAFSNKQYQYFMPFIVLTSMIQGCYFTFLPSLLKYVLGNITNNKNTFLLYLIGGTGMTFGGFFAGKVSQKSNLFIVSWTQVIFIIVFALLAFISWLKLELITTYIAGLFCGIAFTGTESLAAMIAGTLFQDKSYFFVSNNVLTCLGIGLTCTLSLILNKIAFVYMLYIVLIITCLIIGFTVYAYKKSEFGKQTNKIQLQD